MHVYILCRFDDGLDDLEDNSKLDQENTTSLPTESVTEQDEVLEV